MKHIGISRKTLESYEKKGYIHPGRDESSGYRNYTWQDIETAWEKKQLVGIGYTHAEIREMSDSLITADFTESISRKISELEDKIQQLEVIISKAKEIESSGKLPPVPWSEGH